MITLIYDLFDNKKLREIFAIENIKKASLVWHCCCSSVIKGVEFRELK
jgi:predicted membrane protein